MYIHKGLNPELLLPTQINEVLATNGSSANPAGSALAVHSAVFSSDGAYTYGSAGGLCHAATHMQQSAWANSAQHAISSSRQPQ